GQRALGELFPGFEHDLGTAGAIPLRVGLDIRIERPGFDPFPQRNLDLLTHSMSRPLIELAVRRRVEQHANIMLRQRCRAQEIIASPNGAAATGVRYKYADGVSETLSADLVIDASGRGAFTMAFLESIGHPMPEETIIHVDIGYSTAIFGIAKNA